ncbi:MBG domain-containing protein, partial [Acinetobacter sp. ULE_I010]|uniref:MBG domain-containing protein n=1 Tax=Acinetobacter sp. ULE_I010 TaxID=3373065 RepID=UPI003AF65A44
SNTTNAGNHTLTVDGTLSNGNYNITQRTDGTWGVGKKDITVTANSGSSIYGDTNQVNPNFSVSGLVNGETASVLTGLNNSFGISNTTNAGNHTLTVDGTLSNGNYN